MEDESIHELTDELQKFTSFDYPENIRSLANDAVSFFRRGNAPLPINDPESHVVRMIWTIFMNPKLAKSSPNTIVAVLKCISTDLFNSGALDRVLKGIIMVTSSETSIDCDAAAILLEHSENHITDHFPHMILIQITLSMLLSMMSHKDEMISSTTFASFPQVLDSLVKKVEGYSNSDENLDEKAQSDNKELFSQFKISIENQKLNFDKQFDQFDHNPFIYILYLLFNDLTAIALDQKAKWLMLPENYKKSHLPTLIFDVLENIVHVYHTLIEKEPQLISLFEPAVIQSMYDSKALQFIICFIDIYLESHKSLCNGLFEEFLSRIPTHKNTNVTITSNNTANTNNEPSSENLSSSNKKAGNSTIKPMKGLKGFNQKNKKGKQHNSNSGSGNEPIQEEKAALSEKNSLTVCDFSLPQLSKQSISSLFFFRSIGTRQDHFASRLFCFCDDDNLLMFSRLLNTLKQYIENQVFAGTEAPPRKKIHLTFKISPLRWANLKTEKAFQKFIQKSPFETVFGIINSFVASSSKTIEQETEAETETECEKDGTQNHNIYQIDEKFGKYLSKKSNLSAIFRIAVLAMRMCTLETFNLPCNLLLNLLRVLKFSTESDGSSISEAFDESFEMICSFAPNIEKDLPLDTQNALQISDKVGLFYTFLRHIAEEQEEICSGKWDKILDSLFKAKIQLELDFASTFSESELESIIQSAVNIKPLPVMFITNLVIANHSQERFMIIWSTLEPLFNKALDDIDIIISARPLATENINPELNDNSSTASNKSNTSNVSGKGNKNKDKDNDNKTKNTNEAEIKKDSDEKIIQSRNFDSMTLELFLDMMGRAIFNESETYIISMVYTYLSNSKLALEYKERILGQLKQVLTVNADVIKKTWNDLFKILSPANFKNKFTSIEIDDVNSIEKNTNASINTELLQLAFNVLTLLCNDQIHKVPQDSLFNLIDLIISYGSCTVDINLSLSSFDLLWNVARVMNGSSENWKYLMNDVLKLVGDPRSDISQCAVKTFFSLMCTSFEQIPTEVIDYFVSYGFNQILDQFDIDNPKVANSFELALQELAHYSSTFWTSFGKTAAFHDKFLPELIEKAKNFCLTCKNNEIITNSFHFFETMFDCPHLDDDTSELLRKSIQTMTESYLNIKDQNNIIFSCLGRTINLLLFTLKKRNRLETLPRWYPTMKLCITSLTAEGYIHITPQRILDVIPSLFPMCDVEVSSSDIHNNDIDGIEDYDRNSLTIVYSDEKYHSEVAISVFKLLNEFLTSNQKYAIPQFKEFVFDVLCQIYKTQMPNKVRIQFIVICKNLGGDEYSEPLSTLFVDTKIKDLVDTETAPDVFDCFLMIAGRWPKLQEKARDALISVLNKADKEVELKFIHENSRVVPKIILIWQTYFDPKSDNFNQTVYDNCFDYSLKVIDDILTGLQTNTKDQLQVLKFLLEAKSPAKFIEKTKEETNFYHLLKLMIPLTRLITCQNEEIRKLVQDLFEIISNIVSSVM